MIVGRASGSAIATLVDRASRYLRLDHSDRAADIRNVTAESRWRGVRSHSVVGFGHRGRPRKRR
jgi:hypothetical protein